MNHSFSKIALFSAALLAFSAAHAQNTDDALRFSFLQPQGTARSIGFGSALGSIGGDFSTLAVNPAGIGIYRRAEITFTPSLTFSNTEGKFLGNSDEASGSHFAISNIGLVTTQQMRGRNAKSGWTTFSFGLGLTRLADFTRDYSYAGRNTTSSGAFAVSANAIKYGLDPDNNTSLGDLGYQTYLLDTGLRSIVKPSETSPVQQITTVSERGGISELGITLGGSYQDQFMLGGTLGFPIVRYSREKTFNEQDLSGNGNNNFGYFTYNEQLKTSGGGVNLKLGFIYKPTDNFRFGAAIHTPSFLSLTDIYNQDLTANTEAYHGTTSASTLENQYDYTLMTPWRGIVSATALFGGHGFLTADYEYVDYSSARFGFDDNIYEGEVNNAIKKTFQGASNVRAGVEIRIENFQVRGGFGYYGNPYKSGTPGAERLDFSAGFGYRFPNAFIDFGFVHRQYESSEQPYQLAGTDVPGSTYYGLIIPSAQLNTGINNAVLTFGFKL